MNVEQKRRFRTELEALAMRVRADADALSEQVQSGSGQAGSLSTVPVHLGDMGTEEFLQELNATLLDNQQYLVDEARAALRRLEAGTFGKCEGCGKAIARRGWKRCPTRDIACSARRRMGRLPK